MEHHHSAQLMTIEWQINFNNMRRIILLLLLIIMGITLVSCVKDKAIRNNNDKVIDLDDKVLTEVVEKFLEYSLGHSSLKKGIPAMKVHSACENHYVELWMIDHWISFKNGKPKYFTYVNDRPLVIYSSDNQIIREDVLSDSIIQDITTGLISDMSTPPRTGFSNRWLYRIGNPSDSIFSVTDTLLKYDNSEVLERRIMNYTGRNICL